MLNPNHYFDAADAPDRYLDDDVEQLNSYECPCCMGQGHLLGQLGRMYHYRCRDCGWQFSNLRSDLLND
jgi:predicted  nucleic acid-binding Zn ribbon protein